MEPPKDTRQDRLTEGGARAHDQAPGVQPGQIGQSLLILLSLRVRTAHSLSACSPVIGVPAMQPNTRRRYLDGSTIGAGGIPAGLKRL